jgi:hypothetical protein
MRDTLNATDQGWHAASRSLSLANDIVVFTSKKTDSEHVRGLLVMCRGEVDLRKSGELFPSIFAVSRTASHHTFLYDRLLNGDIDIRRLSDGFFSHRRFLDMTFRRKALGYPGSFNRFGDESIEQSRHDATSRVLNVCIGVTL